MLRPFPAEEIMTWKVWKDVGNTRNNRPDLVRAGQLDGDEVDGHVSEAALYSDQMADFDFKTDGLPVPEMQLRKHVLGGRDYVLLSVVHIAERFSLTGEPMPESTRCAMSCTLFPQEGFTALNVEAGQMMLDARFEKRFPEHICVEGCLSWHKLGGSTTSNYAPVTPTIQ